MTNEELITKIATEMVNKYNGQLNLPRKGEFISLPSHVREGLKEQARQMLSVVKSHIGSVAEVCSCVRFSDTGEFEVENKPTRRCVACHGTGVIARGDK